MKLVIAVLVIAALAFGTGVGMLAAGGAGSADDPLITLSYLNGKFKTDLAAEIDALIKARGDELSAKIDTALAGETGGAESADAFKVVTLQAGQALTLSEGSELLVREGSALITGAALSNTTTGEAAQAGFPALLNNMYLAAADGGGITAGDSAVKALVRGPYTIA
jgi:hypothetical protein